MFAERSNDCNAHEPACDDRWRAHRLLGPPAARADADPAVDGRAVRCRPGDTIAAALVDAGIRICRVTGSGEGRGVFCGMGICQECVMTVDGARARTCMTFVRDGMTVAALREGEPLRAVGPATLEPVALAPELLVVGGGPAGLAAAAAAAEVRRARRARGRAREARGAVLQAAVGRLARRGGGARPAVPRRPGAHPSRGAGRRGAAGRGRGLGRDRAARAARRRRRSRVRHSPGAAPARNRRVRAGRAASRLDAAGVPDDGSGADADASLRRRAGTPCARVGQRAAEPPGRGRAGSRAAARWSQSASSRRCVVRPARARMLFAAPSLVAAGREPHPRAAAGPCAAL